MRRTPVICVDDDPNTLAALSQTLVSVVFLVTSRVQASCAAAWNYISDQLPR